MVITMAPAQDDTQLSRWQQRKAWQRAARDTLIAQIEKYKHEINSLKAEVEALKGVIHSSIHRDESEVHNDFHTRTQVKSLGLSDEPRVGTTVVNMDAYSDMNDDKVVCSMMPKKRRFAGMLPIIAITPDLCRQRVLRLSRAPSGKVNFEKLCEAVVQTLRSNQSSPKSMKEEFEAVAKFARQELALALSGERPLTRRRRCRKCRQSPALYNKESKTLCDSCLAEKRIHSAYPAVQKKGGEQHRPSVRDRRQTFEQHAGSSPSCAAAMKPSFQVGARVRYTGLYDSGRWRSTGEIIRWCPDIQKWYILGDTMAGTLGEEEMRLIA